MTSQTRGFRFIDRGFKNTAVLIPGWATDSRIFEPLDLPLNYILPDDMPPFDFEKKFIPLLRRERFTGLSIFGWSMGGFIAANLAARYQSIFKEVVLVSVRERYESELIENIRGYLRRNRRAYLYRFYSELFSEDEKEYAGWFKKNLLEDYLKEMDPEKLLPGLDYLSQASIRPECLKGLSVTIVHGSSDKIAPIEEARAIKNGAPEARFLTIRDAGHAPFLREEFRDIWIKA